MTKDRPAPPLQRRIAWLASAGWMAFIFALSSIPGSSLPGTGNTLGHFAVYAILGGLLLIALLHESMSRGRSLAFAVLLSSAYAVTDELHQAFVPGRVPDVYDWGVDTLGALIGAAVTLKVLRSIERRRSTQ